jgi:putative cardiolipin synthase
VNEARRCVRQEEEPGGFGLVRAACRRRMPGGLARLALVLCAAQLAACAGTVAPVAPPHNHEVHAIADPETTALGKVFAAEAQKHPGLSGFDLITSGRTAFEARYVFAHLAQRTIDAQYFIWADDATGRNMLLALLDAAARGVRVRLLLDDLNLDGQDSTLAAVRAHPNIEVRLFNPFETRNAHTLDLLYDFARLNHRMHNKAFIVDNAVAVIGGRNMADPYFSADEQANFRDLDLFAAGPIVRAASQEFDEFWNSPWATSIHRLVSERPTPDEVHEMVAHLHDQIDATPYPFRTAVDAPFLEHFVDAVRGRLIWGKPTLLADRPDKPMTSEPELAETLHAKVGGAIEKELLLESAYFVPAGNGTAHLCALRQRGVEIRVLTNSLASTDEASAYAGFMRHRDDLLRCGIELHELRPDAAFVQREWTWLRGRSEAELHTKAVVFDRAAVMIGSFNLDPRSRNLNTELAILVESPALAAKVAAFITAGMSLANSFRLELDEDDDVVWVAEDQGSQIRFRRSPNAGLWHRLEADILSLLPIEELL